MNQSGQETEALRVRITQLDEELRRAKARLDLLTSIMGVAVFRVLIFHNVTGFARHVLNVVEMMKETALSDAGEGTVREYLEIMDGGAGKLLESVKNIRTVSAHDEIEAFCVHQLIHEFFSKEFLIYKEEVQIELPVVTDCCMLVRANPWWLKQALRIVAENAVYAMRASRTKILKIAATITDDGYIKINLADTGPGIPTDLSEGLFKRVITSKREHGRGVGAALAAIIVESYDGVIGIEETGEGGANIRMLLPQAVLEPVKTA